MRSNATSAVSARPRLPDAPLWRADRRSGRLCSGADDAHELRLDGVGHHLAPQAELVVKRAAHLDHVADAERLRPPDITETRAVPSLSVKAV